MSPIPWFKVDDKLPAHHKVLTIPRGPRRLAAMGAWTLCGAWTAANLKEGIVPASVVEEMAVPTKVVADLVASGLWLTVPEGYLMHDFLDYNPTAEQVLAERAAAAERQRRARERAKASRRDSGVSHGTVTGAVTVPPTRPDPTRSGLPSRDRLEVELPDSPEHFEEPASDEELEAAAAALCSLVEGWPQADADELARLRERRGAA